MRPSSVLPLFRASLVTLLTLACLVARADVIHLPGGGKIVGVIVEEKDEYVAIKTRGGGVQRVPREDIDRIERGPVPDAPPPAPPPPLPAAPLGPAGGAPVGAPPGGGEAKPEAAPVPAPPGGATPLRPVPGGLPGLGRPATEPGVTFGVDEETAGKKLERDLFGWFDGHKDAVRAEQVERIRRRRKEARDFIMDPRKYPEENHGAAAQPEVDRLVALLRRAIESPFDDFTAPERDADGNPDPSGVPKARALRESLEEVASADNVRRKVNKALNALDHPIDDRDRQNQEDARAAAAYNERMGGPFDSEERACMDETNRYRLLYGLRALRYDERLGRAARKHSKAMVERGFFDHTSPVPGLETPEKRCAAEGANYTAENIAFGSSSGADTLWQWYNSSGHHRNLLGDHSSIGVGKHETHWTQNFGRDKLK